MKWEKIKTVKDENGTTITYAAEDTPLTIESRRRRIQHANRSGYWEYVSYFIMNGEQEIAEKWKLKEAKEYVEGMG